MNGVGGNALLAWPGLGDPGLRIVECLFAGVQPPPAVRLWDGRLYAGTRSPAFTLVVKHPAVLRRLLLGRDPLSLADAYVRGELDVDGDLCAALALREQFEQMTLGRREKLLLMINAMRLPREPAGASLRAAAARAWRQAVAHRHTRASDGAAVRFHYDVSNDFYALWLDAERVYSCAYFHTPDDALDRAQQQKLDHICRKLRLRRDEHFLDIGCGWGALVCWAARHYGVRAHGITLSRPQFEHARARIRALGLEERVSVELRDYRDLPGAARFDKVASIGMFEHVGLANLPVYFATVARVLRPGGLFLNHGITHDRDGWPRSLGTEFINRYVFPDGELDRIGNVQLGMERAGFEIHDVEGLRPHYALTLRHWKQRLEAQREAALRLVDAGVYRTWQLYLAACALAFESGKVGVYQILASRRDAGRWPLPLTRDDLYRREEAGPGAP